MDWHRYRFRSVWTLDAAPAAVYEVLEHAEEYPHWWPQVREAHPIDDTTGTARFRSLLPYDMVITARATLRDPAAGVLEIGMTGDLEGWARWTVGAHNGGARALFEQEVEVRRSLMRALALPGRPLFVANHALMMRAGHRGLRRRLADVV
ncbi:SRPBCC family protein [Streptomyces sp. KR80]|uniref:SRPBCC family protein n=1 Tax=Streptomyces sp. KR80 TaxID=3457426 RepID=UPI003FD68B53